MSQKGPVATATPQASLEVKAVRQEGTDAVGKEVENSSNASSFACSSFRRKVAKYRNGRKRRKPRCWNPSGRPCQCCAGRSEKKEPKGQVKQLEKLAKTVKSSQVTERGWGNPTLFTW